MPFAAKRVMMVRLLSGFQKEESLSTGGSQQVLECDNLHDNREDATLEGRGDATRCAQLKPRVLTD